MDHLLSAAYEVGGEPAPKFEQDGMDGGFSAPSPADLATAYHSEEESLLSKLREFVESKGVQGLSGVPCMHWEGACGGTSARCVAAVPTVACRSQAHIGRGLASRNQAESHWQLCWHQGCGT